MTCTHAHHPTIGCEAESRHLQVGGDGLSPTDQVRLSRWHDRTSVSFLHRSKLLRSDNLVDHLGSVNRPLAERPRGRGVLRVLFQEKPAGRKSPSRAAQNSQVAC